MLGYMYSHRERRLSLPRSHLHLPSNSYLGSREGAIETKGIINHTIVIILKVIYTVHVHLYRIVLRQILCLCDGQVRAQEVGLGGSMRHPVLHRDDGINEDAKIRPRAVCMFKSFVKILEKLVLVTCIKLTFAARQGLLHRRLHHRCMPAQSPPDAPPQSCQSRRPAACENEETDKY